MVIRHTRPSERRGQDPQEEMGNIGVRLINGAPIYNPNNLEQISQDYDLEEEEGWLAVFLAAATMDGAYEDVDGGINSLQTACNELGYDEHLKRSKHMDEAELLNIRAAIEFYHSKDITLANDPEKAQKEMDAGADKVARWLIALKPDHIDRVMDIFQDKWAEKKATSESTEAI